MKKVTAKWLCERDACWEHIILFSIFFPFGAKPTLKNIEKAEKLGLDTEWLAVSMPTQFWVDYRLKHDGPLHLVRNNMIIAWLEQLEE